MFQIQPNQTYSYELVFLPLRVFKGKGSITFLNEKLGEIWYSLMLHSEDNLPIKLNNMRAELGKTTRHTISLENPSDKEVKLSIENSNPTNFSVSHNKISIGPYKTFEGFIEYTPTDINVAEVCILLKFAERKTNRWAIFCSIPKKLEIEDTV